MIPKIIHYCWFGHNPLPPLAEKCIASWKRFLPDYEIKEWNESNFDVNMIPYTAEAYKEKKYAFVSDFARFWILYHYGGLYFDTDVEVIKSMDDIIQRGDFLGCSQPPNIHKSINDSGIDLWCNPGLGMGSSKENCFYKSMIDLYYSLNFETPSREKKIKTIVNYTTEQLCTLGLKNTYEIQLISNIYIYPHDFFNPINQITKRKHITSNTRTIHHFAASWMDFSINYKIKRQLRRIIPESFLIWYNKRKHNLNR